MREYTFDVVKNLSFSNRYNISPFAGSYPTRILIVEREVGEFYIENITRPSEHVIRKVIYLGKPNPIMLKSIRKTHYFSYYEFDRKHMVYGAYLHGMRYRQRFSQSFGFYHPYVQITDVQEWSWFYESWLPLRVSGLTVYNHFGPESVANLKAAVDNKLIALKTPKKASNVRV